MELSLRATHVCPTMWIFCQGEPQCSFAIQCIDNRSSGDQCTCSHKLATYWSPVVGYRYALYVQQVQSKELQLCCLLHLGLSLYTVEGNPYTKTGSSFYRAKVHVYSEQNKFVSRIPGGRQVLTAPNSFSTLIAIYNRVYFY